eukprot:scaffold4493_cov390-Prasinococcus_capsulatus_cf.AAC.13
MVIRDGFYLETTYMHVHERAQYRCKHITLLLSYNIYHSSHYCTYPLPYCLCNNELLENVQSVLQEQKHKLVSGLCPSIHMAFLWGVHGRNASASQLSVRAF